MRLAHLTMIFRWILCAAALTAPWTVPVGAAADRQPSTEQLRFFEMSVRPLLAENCYKCHGPSKQSGQLRLDSIATILAGGESGPAIVPGQPEESLLIEAINYESFEMPPTGKLDEVQIATLTRWIRMGAPWPAEESVLPPDARQFGITDEDRSYWAFQPVQNVTPPSVDDDGWCRNNIDRFIFQRLAEEGLSPSAPAERRALVRRVYFDLIGLPPQPKEVEALLLDEDEGAYERMIDALLDDPRYGERWARHWLDLVRYAESDGFKQDAFRPHAWGYRDYVIRCLNDDKPYDRFVMEQLAGDEIAPHDPDAIVATGYLRHWIYEYNQRDVRTQWDNILNDVTNVTGDVFLGMGMQCARCHDHKFDPILQKDYYRLRAFFAALLPRDDLPLATAHQIAQYRTKMAAWEEQTAEIRKRIDDIEMPYIRQMARPSIEKFPPGIRSMMLKANDDRRPMESQLVKLAFRQVYDANGRLQVESKVKGDDKQRLKELKAELAQYDHLKPQTLPPAFTVSDVGGVAPPTVIPGDRQEEDIAPGFLSVMDSADAKIQLPGMGIESTGRRTALARWITSPQNPLTTRVIVNRIWQYHFGRGLVATSSDFGRLGEPPSHPELLDWLTVQFVEGGWSFKKLHRLIMTSATYRQSAILDARDGDAKRDDPQSIDPDNRLLWRMNTRRLDAEQIRDAMLAVSGELDPKRGGPSIDATTPRRSIYTKVIRNTRDPLLDVFDAPDNFNSAARRNVTTTANQSLLLINGPWTLERARALASRLTRSGGDERQQINNAYHLVYGRQASAVEQVQAAQFLREQAVLAKQKAGQFAATLSAPMPSRDGYAADLKPGGRLETLTVPSSSTLPTSDFTVEACILLRTMYQDASVRTIVSHWDGNKNHSGWSLGVTSKQSKYQPGNLILQLVDDSKLGGAYEVVASDIHLEMNKPYYVAASVQVAGKRTGTAAFFVKDLSTDDAPLQSANVVHKSKSPFPVTGSLVVGGRDGIQGHRWDGLIDDIRLSRAALSHDELLIHADDVSTVAVGYWRFEHDPGFDKDSTANGIHFQLNQSAMTLMDEQTAAWHDFCHVLLNSNEFLYVD